ncbi:MAG: hypothetical protein QOK28_612 [Actinomycetota bacterium]|jgi:predicted TIM-barrel fold metal-dependent hydrolase
MPLDIPVFDADNHLYETRDSLTKFLPDRYKGVIDYVEQRGRTKIVVRGNISQYIPNPTFEVVARPGAQEEYFRKGNPEGKNRRELFGEPIKAIPAFREPKARVELMDEQGLDRTLMFPTLASLVEERMRDEPDMCAAVIHALNEWMYEVWQFDYEGRIFAAPVITPGLVENAIQELDWVVERGARVVLMRPAPAWGYRGPRSFGLPEFDPFWQRVVEHDVLVALHSSDSGYDRYVNEWLGRDTEMLAFQPHAFGQLFQWRPIEDAVASLVCHGTLSRFPQAKVAVIENGASWVGPLLKNLADIYKKLPQDFVEDPVAVVKRNIYISPFWEEDLVAFADMVGEDHVLFGSDFPHPEGLAEPTSYLRELEGAPDERVRKIMGGNLSRLMNVEEKILR